MTNIVIKKVRKQEVKHLPFNRARKCTPREVIYLKHWQNYVTRYLDNRSEWDTVSYFENMCKVLPYSKHRVAMVAASFVTFMGCNGGLDFTYFAEDLARKTPFLSREDAFLAAWGIKNKRSSGINGGTILMECMIERRVYNRNYDRYSIKGINLLTPEDIEILSYMVVWWSSKDASEMREVCEIEFAVVNKEIMKNIFN